MIAAFFFVVDLIGIAVVHLEKNHTPAQSGVFFFFSCFGGYMCLYGQSLCLCFLTLEVSWQAGLGLVVAYDQREGAAARHTEGDLNRGPRGSDNLTE